MNMKTKSILFVWILIALFLSLYSCKKDKETDTPIDEKVEQTYQQIKDRADAILLSDDPITAFEVIAEEYEKMEEVETVQVNKNGLFIKFVNGCITGWIVPQPIDDYEPDFFAEMVTKTVKNVESKSSTKKALFINQQFLDSGRRAWINELIKLSNALKSLGWEVTQANGLDADVDFHRNNLSGYDVIFDIAHGGYMEKPWILTGEISAHHSLKDIYYEFLKRGEICKLIVVEQRANGSLIDSVAVEYYAISPDFIKNAYSTGDFSGAYVYMVPCNSMGHGTGTDKNQSDLDLSMAKAFVDYGKAEVYVGWDETNYSGQRAGFSIMVDLLEGKNLSTAVKHLEDRPTNWRVDLDNEDNDDPDDEYYTATLRYYPSTAGDYTLVELSQDESSSYYFADGVVRLKKTIVDNTDFRTNNDGTKYYKSALAVEIEAGGVKRQSIIATGDELYTEHSKPMNPCMLINLEQKTIFVFTNSKATDDAYGMNGFVYRIDAVTNTWQKETVFTDANWGWFSFFGGTDKGNPELWHFSYAGYYAMLSNRDEQGTWTNQQVCSIDAQLADRQYFSHRNILVTSNAGIDQMSLQDDSSYDSLTGFSNTPATRINGITVVKEILGNN
jgi:hypothetical protein